LQRQIVWLRQLGLIRSTIVAGNDQGVKNKSNRCGFNMSEPRRLVAVQQHKLLEESYLVLAAPRDDEAAIKR
jgi:hypothetical protein